MPIPLEFYPDCLRLGYGERHHWPLLEQEWDQWEMDTVAYAAEQGFTVYLEGRRVWGTDLTTGDEYLLASATEPDSDPMNLWAQAHGRIELLRDLHLPEWAYNLVYNLK